MKNIIKTSSPIESRITAVTVYLSGAQITRTGSFEASAGVLSFVFGGLPERLQAGSIQASVDDGVVIQSVEHIVNHMRSADQTEEISALQQKLKDLEDRLQQEKNLIGLGELEEKFFAENMHLAGNETGLKADELKAAVLFYNERMAAVRETRTACNKRSEELNRQISAIKSQLGAFDRNRPDPVSEITVTVAADEETAKCSPVKKLTLSYYVYNANWKPSYDIRVKDTSGGVALHYKANVSQNTGENWEEVKLVLSTGNPSVGGECPRLDPWYIAPTRPAFRHPFNLRTMAMKMTEAMPCESEPGMANIEFIEDDIVSAAVMTESMTSVEYTITAPYTIADGEGGQDVEITVHSLPAEYRYFSVPKLEREVFLLAAASEWEHLNLIAGEASVFFENRYVGKTYIDPHRAEEKIDLSLGADQSVIVTRVRGRDFTAKTLTGVSVKQTRQWELTARNLKTEPIEIELLDQVPVSTDKQIVVDVVDISNAELDKDTGILKWKFTLNPAESKTMNIAYIVTSPKNIDIWLD